MAHDELGFVAARFPSDVDVHADVSAGSRGLSTDKEKGGYGYECQTAKGDVPRRRTRWKRLDDLPHPVQVLLRRSVEQGRDAVERHVVDTGPLSANGCSGRVARDALGRRRAGFSVRSSAI